MKRNDLYDEGSLYSDGYDEDFYGNAEDRARLVAMSEIEREAILFERSQERSERRERKALEAKVTALEGGVKPSVSNERPREQLRPTHAASSRPQFLIEDAKRLFVSRSIVEKYLFYPEFEDFIIGSLVRIKLGSTTYRVATVTELVVASRFYTLSSFKTNRASIVAHGKSEKQFTFDFLSNSEFTKEEFDAWYDRCIRDGIPFAKAKKIEEHEEIGNTMTNHSNDDELINYILTQRKQFTPQSLEQSYSDRTFEHDFAIKKPKYIPTEVLASTDVDATFNPFSRRKCNPASIHGIADVTNATSASPNNGKSDKKGEEVVEKSQSSIVDLDIDI